MSAVLIGFVILQRLAEIVYANHNSSKLIFRGAVEYGRDHYPFMVVLHTAWILSIAFMVIPEATINPYFLAGYVLLQFLRVWVLATLGEYWTTRVFVLPDHIVVLKGLYKYLKHPNYIVVVLEIAVFPMIFGLVFIAIGFSLLKLLVLGFRLRAENEALGFNSSTHPAESEVYPG